MSSGHHHQHAHSKELCDEVTRLLADEKVRAFMKRPYTVSFSRKIPLTGGSNIRGDVYYIDSDVPAVLRSFILWHERVEKALRQVLEMSYDRAHVLATCAEHMRVEEAGHSWEDYKKRVAPIVRENEKRRPFPLPSSFDTGPMRESGYLRKSTV